MKVKKFVLSLNLLTDRRVPRRVRRDLLLRDDGTCAIYGATHPNRKEIYLDIANLSEASLWAPIRDNVTMYDDFVDNLVQVFDHEYAHASMPKEDRREKGGNRDEERTAWLFEFAGVKVRNDGSYLPPKEKP